MAEGSHESHPQSPSGRRSPAAAPGRAREAGAGAPPPDARCACPRARPPPVAIKGRRAASSPQLSSAFCILSLGVSYCRLSDPSSQNGETDRQQGTRSRGRPGRGAQPSQLGKAMGPRWQAVPRHPGARGAADRPGSAGSQGLGAARAHPEEGRRATGSPAGQGRGDQRCPCPGVPCRCSSRSPSPGKCLLGEVWSPPLASICIWIRAEARRWKASWRKHGLLAATPSRVSGAIHWPRVG